MAIKINNVLDKDYITNLSNKRDEPEWLLDLRLKGLECYKRLPSKVNDKGKDDYWDIEKFKLDIEPGEISEEELPDEVNSIISSNIDMRSVLIYGNSSIMFQHLSEELINRGVIFTSLAKAVKEYPELVKDYLMNSIKFDEDKLLAMHTALWDSGVFLYVPQNIEIDFPVQAIFIGNEGAILPHVVIVAEANSRITYVDNHLSNNSSNTCTHNSITEVFVREGAKVRIATNNNFNDVSFDYTYRQAIVDKDGLLEWTVCEMNFGNTISTNTCLLNKSGARTDIKTIFIGTENQKANFTTKVIHDSDYTQSNILFRGIMLGTSKGIFNGITKINKGAVKSNAEQTENILMLSENARGDANPILLIDEHDVMASHAASAGPVNQEDIYYLMSRGIARQEAERLIIHGFLAPIVSGIPIEGMKEQIEGLIERKLI
ncbi:MAG: Fe-S cluster assembly protein SufD [Vulcanibacillus sp.]